MLRGRTAVTAVLALGLIGACGPCGNAKAVICAPISSGDLYYTRYSGTPNVKRVHYTYTNGVLALAQPTAIATTQGADGIAFAPDGDLLVGSSSDVVHKVHIADGKTLDLKTGGGPAYHISVDPSGKLAWVAGIPGQLTRLPLSPPATGSLQRITGDDGSVTTIAFDGSGHAHYTASGSGGTGNYGDIDLKALTTKRRIANRAGLHGMAFDPHSGDLVTFGGDRILQIDPKTGSVLSELQVKGGVQLDQGTVNGEGFIYVASNNGQLVLIDYTKSKRVGDAKNAVIVQDLEGSLDDVAPVSGPGAKPCQAH